MWSPVIFFTFRNSSYHERNEKIYEVYKRDFPLPSDLYLGS
jgi:hypothetical protein